MLTRAQDMHQQNMYQKGLPRCIEHGLVGQGRVERGEKIDVRDHYELVISKQPLIACVIKATAAFCYCFERLSPRDTRTQLYQLREARELWPKRISDDGFVETPLC